MAATTSAKRFSPGAALLRRSRLIAMPAPVPSPPSYFLSNPDVAPHPTIQAITTPASSHGRGNWGLKRDLPTKTKYPYLRYTQLDTLEHFTTYESASDDVLTLKKWQEMDVPILRGPTIDTSALASMYTVRNTVFDFAPGQDIERYRWRFEGPYIPDMPAGDFKRYVKTSVKPRRAEFLSFVAKNQRKFASHPDVTTADTADTAVTVDDRPSEVDLLALRADTYLLGRLVVAFLDLPTVTRPHRTHPSGGLHYTRSSAPLRNDPLDGPQTAPKPVQGRYLNYSGASGTMIGVGGFVAKSIDAMRLEDPLRLYNNRQHTRNYIPGKARLDALGRVLLDVDTVTEGGSMRGAYGLQGRGGGDAAALLRGFGGKRSWGSLYDANSELGGSGRAQGTPLTTRMQTRIKQSESHTEAIMDLLNPHKKG